MDDLSFIIEIVGWILDALLSSADIYSWFKGKPNRIERKDARKLGTAAPRRDNWNRWTIYFTVGVCLLTIILLTWKSTRSQAWR